ncbi:MAG: ribonuclease R [Bacteroidota bacterium]
MLKRIHAYLKAHADQSFSAKKLTTEANLWSEISNQKLKSYLDKLADQGKIAYLGRGQYKYQTPKEFKPASGILEVTRSGVGFLLVEDGEDIFIGPNSMGKALHGDMVKVKLIRSRRKNGRQEGEVLEVIQRSRLEFVGTIEEAVKGSYFMLPDDRRVKTDFYIPEASLKDAKPGQKVLAKMVNWERRSPEAEVITVLGDAGEHGTEMHAILLQYGFNPNFPAVVEAEAAAIPEKIPAKEIKARRDMREVLTFTIDPTDAKDFDDAISFQVLGNGLIEVGVHIADVSHYVKPGTELDKEAFHRATSVYLVDRTVPMLPEKLSNGVCSLRPHEDKLTYSAVFQMDDDAKIHDYWIGRTVTHSDHRFDYDGAQAVLEGTAEGPYKEEVLKVNELAQKLREKRMGQGSIHFESNEVKFELDEEDKPIRVIKKEMKDANFLIEDFMLLANRTVASHIFNLKENPPLPSVYRIHDQPDGEKLLSLQQFVKAFGHEVDLLVKGDTSGRLNDLLHKVQNKPEKNVVETLAIRTMAKAVYSTKNIGHFGLGFPFYTHFTSPIRRYPDLMVHRLITAYHNQVYRENPVVLEEQCKHCSDRERTAAEAERASIKYKQVEFMEDKIGQAFPGIISGVIESGIFVELEDNYCEGMVPVHSLDDDYYVFDEATYSLKGKDTGAVLQLGDRVRVAIDSIDLVRRTIDMTYLEKLAPEPVS